MIIFKYKKDLVILKLVKTETDSWAVLMQRGLDQAPDPVQ